MYKCLGSFLGIFVLICISCGRDSNRPLTPTQQAFQKQINRTCQHSNAPYKKVVTDLNTSDSTQEVHITELDTVIKEQDSCLLFIELQYAIEEVYDDPRYAELYIVEEIDDTLIARLDPESAASTALKRQKILKDSASQIRYLETQLMQDSWLYKTRIYTEVFFDESGNYHSHNIQSTMQVSTIEQAFRARIQGNLVSNE